MKTIEYYKYETPKVKILWRGIVQPVGYFKTATEANRFINDNMLLSVNDLQSFKIYTPDGLIIPVYDPLPMFNPYNSDL